MKELVELLATSLVDNPSLVNVSSKEEGTDTTFSLSVGREDLGKIIGKKGRTAKALRAILMAAGAKQNKRIMLEILEPEEPAQASDNGSDR